ICREFVEPGSLIQSALLGAVPCSRRPALNQGKKADLIRGIRVFVDIYATGAGSDQRECLNGDVALLQARQIDMATAGLLEQVAVPEQTVGMEIGHNELSVQLVCRRGSLVRRRFEDFIHPAFNDGWNEGEGPKKNRGENQESQPKTFH
ncbi:MAG TPA: hypothetical protein VFF39_10330, partial [Verrucomicrobiae bacterium]|nr:hypothetical protein [Verrucomicrobiae bacterium]